MACYNYVGTFNSNLVCCICRMPFTEPLTTRTCSHTFCQSCITRAIEHAPFCPIDRSSLSLQDLLPADPIIRNLVDELIVECPHRGEGCVHTCQRQLLALHLQDGCQFAQTVCPERGCDERIRKGDLKNHAKTCPHRAVTCDGCSIDVRHCDLEAHHKECPVTEAVCSFCSVTLARSELTEHNATCPDYIVPCTHSIHGCPWTGPRRTLATTHIPCCPYDSFSEFFSLNQSRMARLTEENILLKHRLGCMDAALQTLKHEMHAVRTALGPWYRPDVSHPSVPPEPVRTYSLPPDPPPPPASFDPFALAAYFPPAAPTQTQVAPVDLSTTLEGTFAGLHASLVALSDSLDALARRQESALRGESVRLNDEIGTLRAAMHGLRMQVHGIMMDRNAQVTGRAGVNLDPRWPADTRFYGLPQATVHMPPSVTKL